MYPSPTTFSWNSIDIGPHRDLVGEIGKATRTKGLHFGLYFSQYEWLNPLYLLDIKDGTNLYPQQVSIPQMYEIAKNYNPDIIWSDGRNTEIVNLYLL